eukprot:TRINITY_DN8204_c0_g1_i1.p1 TRINITY_DN8204_c0_g1~~TRINITY_DN8204_c0_g1_i1.p1  ORF type:complete len:239 (+),score=44.82 TRINITY_DN8204_c0_g1_i1:53-769(+)
MSSPSLSSSASCASDSVGHDYEPPRLCAESVQHALAALAGACNVGASAGAHGASSVHGLFECVEAPQLPFESYMAHIMRAFQHVGMQHDDTVAVAAAALVLMRRVALSGQVWVTELTVHRLGLVCFVLARKAMIDTRFASQLSAHIGGVSAAELNQCEAAVLCVLDWDVNVSVDEAGEALEFGWETASESDLLEQTAVTESGAEWVPAGRVRSSGFGRVLGGLKRARTSLAAALRRGR